LIDAPVEILGEWRLAVARRADHLLVMEEELGTVKTLPGFWEVVREIPRRMR
jgi:hypothetical protein